MFFILIYFPNLRKEHLDMNKNSYYIYDKVSKTELVLYTDSSLSYPLHNHSSIFSIGIILNGSIRLCKDGYSSIYTAGQIFIIRLTASQSLYGTSPLLSGCAVHTSQTPAYSPFFYRSRSCHPSSAWHQQTVF